MWYGERGLSAWLCHSKEHLQEVVVHTEGLSPVSDPPQARQPQPFHAPHKALCTKRALWALISFLFQDKDVPQLHLQAEGC